MKSHNPKGNQWHPWKGPAGLERPETRQVIRARLRQTMGARAAARQYRILKGLPPFVRRKDVPAEERAA